MVNLQDYEQDLYQYFSTEEELEKACLPQHPVTQRFLYVRNMWSTGFIEYRCQSVFKSGDREGQQCDSPAHKLGGCCNFHGGLHGRPPGRTPTISLRNGIFSKYYSPEDKEVVGALKQSAFNLQDKATEILNHIIVIMSRMERLANDKNDKYIMMTVQWLAEQRENGLIPEKRYYDLKDYLLNPSVYNVNALIKNAKGIIDSLKDYDKSSLWKKESDALWKAFSYIVGIQADDNNKSEQAKILQHIEKAKTDFEKELLEIYYDSTELSENENISQYFKKILEIEKSKDKNNTKLETIIDGDRPKNQFEAEDQEEFLNGDTSKEVSQ